MSNRILTIHVTCILLSPLLPGCGSAVTPPITQRHPTWNSLGGVSVAKPRPVEERILIPVRVLDPEWKRTHAILRFDWCLSGDQIQFWIVMDAIAGEFGAASDQGILIDPVRAGTYEVAYRDPDGALHRSGFVTITREGEPTQRVVYLGLSLVILGYVLLLWFRSIAPPEVAPQKTIAHLLEYAKRVRQKMPRAI
jgi:hypothetical protein